MKAESEGGRKEQKKIRRKGGKKGRQTFYISLKLVSSCLHPIGQMPLFKVTLAKPTLSPFTQSFIHTHKKKLKVIMVMKINVLEAFFYELSILSSTH